MTMSTSALMSPTSSCLSSVSSDEAPPPAPGTGATGAQAAPTERRAMLDEAYWEERRRKNLESWRRAEQKRRRARGRGGIARKIHRLEDDNIRLRQEIVDMQRSSRQAAE